MEKKKDELYQTIRPLLQQKIEKLLTDSVEKLLGTVQKQESKITKITDVLRQISDAGGAVGNNYHQSVSPQMNLVDPSQKTPMRIQSHQNVRNSSIPEQDDQNSLSLITDQGRNIQEESDEQQRPRHPGQQQAQ